MLISHAAAQKQNFFHKPSSLTSSRKYYYYGRSIETHQRPTCLIEYPSETSTFPFRVILYFQTTHLLPGSNLLPEYPLISGEPIYFLVPICFQSTHLLPKYPFFTFRVMQSPKLADFRELVSQGINSYIIFVFKLFLFSIYNINII